MGRTRRSAGLRAGYSGWGDGARSSGLVRPGQSGEGVGAGRYGTVTMAALLAPSRAGSGRDMEWCMPPRTHISAAIVQLRTWVWMAAAALVVCASAQMLVFGF